MAAAVTPALPLAAAHATGSADIEITEIAYGGLASGAHAYAGDAGDGEYVELTNVGTAAQDFTGWSYGVTKGSASSVPVSGTVSLSSFGIVQPGESVLVTDLAPADFRTEWGLKSSVKVINDGTTSIDSGADTVAIFNGGTAVDSLGYAKSAMSAKGVSAEVLAGQTAATNISAGYKNPSTVGDTDGAWTSAAGAVGSPGASDLGTRTAAQVRETGETGAIAGADIQITELAYGGLASGAHAYAGDAGDGEYVELTNVGYAAQDLTGWTYGATKTTTAPTSGTVSLTGLGTLQPGQSGIITDLSIADFKTEWGLKSTVPVVNDGTTTINGGPDTLGVFNNIGTLIDSLGYAAGFLSAKGVSTYVNYGQLASTTTATGWTTPATVGDIQGSWASVAGAIGSPGASTYGTSTATSVRAPATLTVSGGSNQTAVAGTAFIYSGLSAAGGTSPYTWSAPALAGTGLNINSSTGAITGTPTAVGVINVAATVTDGASATANASFTIAVTSGIDPNWANIVINEVTSDNNDNTELTSKLPPALFNALNAAPNASSDLVELYNKGSQAVDITGWKQADSHGVASATVFSGRVFNVSGTAITSIPAHGYGVFQSGQGLGSGGDASAIYLPDGTLVDSVTYGAGQAGYDESIDPGTVGPAGSEVYHALARCPSDGSGAVNTNANDTTTSWYSVKVASFDSSNNTSCDDSTDATNAVQYYNQQPATGLPGNCTPSAPSGSNSVSVPDAVAWPTTDGVTTADNACEFVTAQDPTGNDMSGLVFSSDGSVLWGAQNKNHVWKLVKDPATGKFLPATDNSWSGGKAITFTGTDPNASQPDSEGLTVGGNGDLFVTSERDNANSNVSKDEVLEYDPTATGTTLTPVKQWDLTADFVPSQIAATGGDANLGFEGVTYVPDSFLTSQGFRDQRLNKIYNPADYPLHGSGLFFAALEKNGHVYAYALNSDGSFQRIADIDTGIDGSSAIADVQYNADDQGIWIDCDNDCGVVDSLLKINASGNFTRVVSYNRPAGLPNDNLEGFAIAPASTATNGKRLAVWADDGIYGTGSGSAGWGHGLWAGTIPVPTCSASGTSIGSGCTLAAGQSISHGSYSLVLQTDGNLVEYDGSGPVWAADTIGAGNYAVMQPDGNFVLYSELGSVLLASDTAGHPGATLTLGTDGEIVVKVAGVALWAAPSELVPGQVLKSGAQLTSLGRDYTLRMQFDGNLVEYSTSGAVFSTGTSSPGAHLVMQGDGNLVLYSTSGSPLWASNTSGNSGATLGLGADGSLTVGSSTGAVLWGGPSVLGSGQTLASGQAITPQSGPYQLVMQADGNLVEYDGNTATWASGTSSSGAHAVMQGDGNLVIYSSGGSALWASNTPGNAGAFLRLSANGDLVVTGADGSAVWGAPGFLASGQTLASAQSINSANGQFQLAMQADGNLAEYALGGTLVWSFQTNTPGSYAVMQADGNFVVYGPAGAVKLASNTDGHPGAHLEVGNDGSVTVVGRSGAVLWTAS